MLCICMYICMYMCDAIFLKYACLWHLNLPLRYCNKIMAGWYAKKNLQLDVPNVIKSVRCVVSKTMKEKYLQRRQNMSKILEKGHGIMSWFYQFFLEASILSPSHLEMKSIFSFQSAARLNPTTEEDHSW